MKKNILFISHSSALTGGGEDDYERLLKHFSSSKKYNIFGVFPSGPRADKYSSYCMNYKTYRASWFPFNYESIYQYLRYFYFSIIQIFQVLPFTKNLNIDLVIFNVGVQPVMNILFLVKGLKQINIIREHIKPDLFRRFVYFILNKISVEIITVSKQNAEDFIKLTNRKKPIYTVYSSVETIDKNNTVEFDLFVQNDDKLKNFLNISENVTILQIGNVSPIKNQMLLVEALGYIKLNYKNKLLPKVIFIGDYNVKSSYSSKVFNKIKELELDNYFYFCGRLSRQNTYYILRKIDLLVIASLNEGLPLVISEAFQFGKPIISTKNGGSIDVIIENYNGSIVNYSPESLGTAIIKYYDKPLLQQCSVNALKSYEKYFNLITNLNNIENIVDKAF